MDTTTMCQTMTVPEAAKMLGIGRNQAYKAAHSGEIPTIKIGKRLLVPVAALQRKLDDPKRADLPVRGAG